MCTDTVFSQLNAAGIPVRREEPLAKHTGFETGGAAALAAFPESEAQFIDTMRVLRETECPYFVLGKGKNVVAYDEGYDGCVVFTEKALQGVEFCGNKVTAGAGVVLSTLSVQCAQRGLDGLSFAYGLPGTVGGAVFMNAGAYGGEVKDVLESAHVLHRDGTISCVSAEDLALGYRTSALQASGDILLSATFCMTEGEPTAIRAVMDDLMGRRRSKQPLEYPSCGSTFKRPEGDYASRLVDVCGLRGRRVGGAMVSEKHCGFVINAGGATTKDILDLIEVIRDEVRAQTGITLECEVRFIK